MSEAVSYVFAWHSLSDACPKCQRLNNRDFWLRGRDLDRGIIWALGEGEVWDLDKGHSLAHPNCRCQLELRNVEIETDVLFAELKQIMLDLKQQLLMWKGK